MLNYQRVFVCVFVYWLVVDLPLWKIWKSNGIIVPNIWKNIKCSKPPTSIYIYNCIDMWTYNIQLRTYVYIYICISYTPYPQWKKTVKKAKRKVVVESLAGRMFVGMRVTVYSCIIISITMTIHNTGLIAARYFTNLHNNTTKKCKSETRHDFWNCKTKVDATSIMMGATTKHKMIQAINHLYRI